MSKIVTNKANINEPIQVGDLLMYDKMTDNVTRAKFKKNILGVNISRIRNPIPKTANNSHKCIKTPVNTGRSTEGFTLR